MNLESPFSLGPDLERLSATLEDSYFAHKRIHHLSDRQMPARGEMAGFANDVFALLFPGFFGVGNLHRENISPHLRFTLDRLSKQLYQLVYQCLSSQSQHEPPLLAEQASQITMAFFRKLPPLREILEGDAIAAYRGDPAAQNTDEVLFSYPSTIAIGTYRIAHLLWELKVPIMPRFMAEKAHAATGVDIHPGAQIGKNFFIDHGTGVVIGQTTVIGDNCKLYQGVTLGAVSFPHDPQGRILRGHKRHPTLEDEVVVYSNASILGDVTIGKGATIGGNVFLLRSVPAGCTVTARPGELRYKNEPTGNGPAGAMDYQI